MSIVRSVIDKTIGLIGRLRRGRRLSPVTRNHEVVKINLGCGLAVAPDWVNVDASLNALVAGWPRPFLSVLYRLSGSNRYYTREQYCSLLSDHRFVHHDLGNSIPFIDASVDFVYSSHFLEHLFKHEAVQLLRESHRVLRRGGVVRVCIPDLAYAVSLYAKGESARMLDDYFFVEDQGSFLARHKYMYDFESLSALLRSVGFSDVRRCGYRLGVTPDLAMLDNRPDETLYVEAIK